MKARVVQGGIGTYEVEVKAAWYMPWQPVYDGMFPFRGSYSEAKKIADKFNK
ncbi:hypothetical protein [Paludibacter sp. 221]|uniref:hypothetical protein n=1 Tax=Paludibacter sp. 221 TaxID=2302939 RepID=UPI0013D32E9D|nr:hypothetical protein [Paludibacter sp. 221]